MAHKSPSAAIHQRLSHPVIDSDGHWVEFEPVLLEYLDGVAGPSMVDRFRREDYLAGLGSWSRMTLEERSARRPIQPAWWGLPARNALDRATSMLPKLMYERLDDIGLDFAIAYPTLALFFPTIKDHEVALAGYRAYNMMAAELFKGLGDRLIPAACIPMNTPSEALAELEFATGRGLKAMMMTSLMRRPIKAAHKNGEPDRYATWPDELGLESEYDYDPVWAKCVELRVVPTFHSGSQGIGTRVSYSNFVYNHIGHFAAAGEAVCKSLFLNGVTRRFPTLKFAFLEGGVGWACMLFSDLIGHWKKRNLAALENTNPANLDVAAVAESFRHYGDERLAAHVSALGSLNHLLGDIEPLDDFGRCGITRPEDIRDMFVPNFYFGCEADDPVNAWAFRPGANPYGVRLHAIMGSDIGHFDVTDMTEVLAEAYELVERRQLDEEGLRDFVFGNPVRFWGGANPNFFKGTVVEKPAAECLAREHAPQQAAAAGS
ncbi:MAG TPA: amidohydrolase family protein [Candidatus Binataceae bacterium]|nr:amidohydrolase family protein [Candidatus Binataceae bacterium]